MSYHNPNYAFNKSFIWSTKYAWHFIKSYGVSFTNNGFKFVKHLAHAHVAAPRVIESMNLTTKYHIMLLSSSFNCTLWNSTQRLLNALSAKLSLIYLPLSTLFCRLHELRLLFSPLNKHTAIILKFNLQRNFIPNRKHRKTIVLSSFHTCNLLTSLLWFLYVWWHFSMKKHDIYIKLAFTWLRLKSCFVFKV